MSAIKFDELIEFLRKQNMPYVKISDLAKKRVVEYLEDDNVENTIAELQRIKPTLASYGRLNFKCADEKQKTAKWNDPFCYVVDFMQGSTHIERSENLGGNPPRGYVSEREAALMAELSTLNLSMQFQKQFDDLKKQIDGSNNGDPLQMLYKFLPIAPLFIKDPTKLDAMAKMAGAMNGNNQNTFQIPQGLAGNTSTIHTQMTEQEQKQKMQIIGQGIDALIAHVGIEKVEKLIVGINAKPHLVDTALTFL
jgi:hypothetical protein